MGRWQRRVGLRQVARVPGGAERRHCGERRPPPSPSPSLLCVDWSLGRQWEEFSLAELTSFLRVLEREEAAHERHIREKYRQMRDTMQRLRPIAESR